MVLKRTAVRYRHPRQEPALVDAELDSIITVRAPMIRDLHGVGTEAASQLLVTVGDNPGRIGAESNQRNHGVPQTPCRP